jgi:2-oxoisovalerate dehydrogenase E1 component
MVTRPASRKTEMVTLPEAPFDAGEAFRRMLTIRRFEESCYALSHDGTISGSIHLCMGQEAIPVGVCAALRSDDRLVTTYRGHGWAIARGVPLVPLLAEICHRAGGINGGRAGSALLSAPDLGFLGENSIVGAGVPVAGGAAIAAQFRGTGSLVVVSIGDGAMNQGSVTEGMVFAAARNLPLVIICENNGWSEMTQTAEIVRGDSFCDRARSIGIEALEVDGCDPYAVFNGFSEAAALARGGGGPFFLECRTVRLGGHYNRDIQHYRSRQDVDDAVAREPLAIMRDRVGDDLALGRIEDEISAQLADVVREVLDMPEPDPRSATQHITGTAPPLSRGTIAQQPTSMTYQRAINRALADELETRPEVILFGEDVGSAGGIFGVSRGLQKRFGSQRVFDTPISESAILGGAVGAAMEGMRPVAEIMWGDFLLVALDQVINQAANVRFVNRSNVTAPMVVRFQQGATPGSCAQHAQSLEALIAHIPGLKLGLPATPQDAYAMTRAAVADPDPVLLAESRELYQVEGDVVVGTLESVGGARLIRPAGDLGVLTWGAMVPHATAAAHQLSENGVETGVLDLRWLAPLDLDAIDSFVTSCNGRVLIAHQANRTGGFGGELAALIHERHFDALRAPVMRVAPPDVRIAAAPVLLRQVMPSEADIVSAALSVLRLDGKGVERVMP